MFVTSTSPATALSSAQTAANTTLSQYTSDWAEWGRRPEAGDRT
jgi:hypothetical protein